jgi:hypothetical protein
MAHEFSLVYPLFAVQRGTGYVAFDLGAASGSPRAGMGVPVFTSEADARQFIERDIAGGEVKRFENAKEFRKFLRGIRDAGICVLFDLLPNDKGDLHTERVFPAAVVLERFMPEPGFGWSYPVYYLAVDEGFACVDGASDDGQVAKLAAFFTDADLANRAIAAWGDKLVRREISSNQEFAAWLKSCEPSIAGVAFDPPPASPGNKAKHCVWRDTLLETLTIEI